MDRRDERSKSPAVLSLVEVLDARREAVRPERVREARAKIDSGYYDRPDVRRALAEALRVELIPS